MFVLSPESHPYLGCRDPDHFSCSGTTGVQFEYLMPGVLSGGMFLINDAEAPNY